MRQLSLDELNRPDLETYRESEKFPIVFVLDNIRSALNVGSIFRTADALGLEGVHLCGITAQPPHRDILKTAIGATESVVWTADQTTVQCVDDLHSEGYYVVAVEQTDKSVSIQNFKVEGKLALVLGNEVKGVSPEVLAVCDAAIEIPQFGTKHSFNVSVCAGIVGWELVKRLL